MPSLDSQFSFFAASLLLAITPGPDNLFVLTQAAVYGRRAGIAITFGLCSGLLVHTSFVALGVASIVHRYPTTWLLLKLFGAIYLLYMAWHAFWAGSSSEKRADSELDAVHQAGKSQRGDDRCREDSGPTVHRFLLRLYGRGILMNLTNPKVTIFFLAFLPPFVDPDGGSPAIQMLWLGGLFMVATVIVFGGIAFMAGYLRKFWAESNLIQRVINRTAAAVLVLMAVYLIAEHDWTPGE